MNPKALILIMNSIPEPIENMNTYQNWQETVEKKNKLYLDAKSSVIRSLIFKTAYSHIDAQLPDNDINDILGACKYDPDIQLILSKKRNLEQPSIDVDVLIEILQTLTNENYHYDAARTSILNSIICFTENITYPDIVKILKTYKNDDGRLDVLDLLIKTVISLSTILSVVSFDDYSNAIVEVMNTTNGKERTIDMTKKYCQCATYEQLVNIIRCIEEPQIWSNDLVTTRANELAGKIRQMNSHQFNNFYTCVANKWSVSDQIIIMDTMIMKIEEFIYHDYFYIIKLFFRRAELSDLFKIIDIITPKVDKICSNDFSDILIHFKSKLGSKDIRELIRKISKKTDCVNSDTFIDLVKLFKPSLGSKDLEKTIKLILKKTQKLSLKQYEEFMSIFEKDGNSTNDKMKELIKPYLLEQPLDEKPIVKEKPKKKEIETTYIKYVNSPDGIWPKDMVKPDRVPSYMGRYNGVSVNTVNGKGIKTHEWWDMDNNYNIVKIYKMREYAW